MTIDCKAKIRTEQFITIRNYRNFTWTNVEKDINKNNDLQSMFGEENPEIIAEKLLRGLNEVIKKHVPTKRIQLRKTNCPYWNSELSESLEKVKAFNRVANETGTYDNERQAKHARNAHS